MYSEFQALQPGPLQILIIFDMGNSLILITHINIVPQHQFVKSVFYKY